MKHVDVKSFLIGVLFTLLVFVSIGAEDGEYIDGNLGACMVQKYEIDCLLLNCNPIERTLEALKVIKKYWSKKC